MLYITSTILITSSLNVCTVLGINLQWGLTLGGEMLTKNEGFLSWEERIISQDKGNRVVHYYLTHSVDDSVLAIKGTERSVRHMIYVVSDTFVEDYGTLCKVNAATKWRSRREVVDWLTKLVSKHQPPRSGQSNFLFASSYNVKHSFFY